MADTRRYSAAPQLDIEKILVEANSRWLRPAEICEILRNYKNFRIAPEAPNRPPSGMLFLFDKKVLRYFRKDGHNWRKKKDGKTVKEAHEKLKDGSVDVLHCYYAHGEDDEKFQRRTYWMLEEDYSHIVLVHYREVKGNKLAYGQSTENEETSRHINMESPASSNSMSNHHLPVPFSAAITESPNSSQTYEYEDAESDNHQASSRYHPHFELQQFERGPVKDVLDPYFHHATSGSKGYHPTNVSDDAKFQTIMNGPSNHQVDLPSWDRVLEHCAVGSSEQPFSKGKDSSVGEVFLENLVNEDSSYVQDSWQVGNADGSSVPKRGPDYSVLLKQLSLDIPNREGEASLKKYDSFTTWMSKEFDEVEESCIQTGSSVYWDTLDSEGVIQDAGISHNDAYIVGPSLSQDQLYSILDISPNWSSTRGETKVRVTGKFLMDENEASSIMWSCMFGEVEVPAEVSGHGVLMCCAPQHKSGRVPFYVTCSNRLACSEIREFEYAEVSSEVLLHARFEELLSLEFEPGGSAGPSISGEKLQLSSKIVSLLRENDDEWSTMLMSTGDPYPLHERVLKEKLLSWLSFKIAEEGKGPAVLDKEGQGIVHLAAALGYDWAIAPTIIAGVSIDFRDIRGWTALHWAAFCGREKTVGVLFSLGAAPGVLTDPTPEFPSGRTPADLASANGHKGIAGFLAESSLTKHLCTLTLKEMGATNLAQEDMIAGDVARTSALPMDDGNMEASLSAFRNAAQAAARIHQVYRVQSFQRKKLEEEDEYGDDRFGMSNAQALSMLSVRSNNRAGQHAEPVAAAIQIQKKFRGWKGRRDFLTIRQNVVKIQALVRGHQVRRHYKKIVWTVGIVEKAILRWRRKRTGLRSFKPEGSAPSPSARERPIEEDDYDFLKEGQKQTEARLVKALDRVKSMVQYPEARDQYRRLLTVVEDLQESRAVLEKVLNDPEVMESEPMFDIDELLGDDPYMAIT